PGPIVAGDRPEVPFLCVSAARIKHRRHRLVERDLGRVQNEFPQPKIQRFELRGHIAHPKCQRHAFDRDAWAQQHLGLAIERQMPSIFGNQDRGHGSPPLISRSGAGAWTTPCSQLRQAYWGRCVTITRYWAEMTSRRLAVSSPMTCVTP